MPRDRRLTLLDGSLTFASVPPRLKKRRSAGVAAASVAATAIGCAPVARSSVLDRLNARVPEGARIRLVVEHPMNERSTIAKYVLDNGLTVIVLRDSTAPVFAYSTRFRVGSRHEREGKTGLAHLFEHLMFNETEHLAAGEFDRSIERAGGRTNAATWTDWTFYYETLPAPNLAAIVRMEADRMANLVLRDPQVQSEREVVANERRYRVDDDVEGRMSELLFQKAYTVHPYGWPTIGWMRDIEGFNTADCRDFYRTYYAPNNAIVVAVGDFDERALLGHLQRRYGSLARQDVPATAVPVEPPQTSERRVEVALPTPTEKLQMSYHVPGFTDFDHVAMDVLAEILFGGRSSRLYRELVLTSEIAAEAQGSVTPFQHPGLFEIRVSMREGHAATEALARIDAALRRLEAEDVPDAELEKVKNRLDLAFWEGLEDARGKAEQLGFYETVAGDFRALFGRVEDYGRVTPADVRRVAQNLLRPNQRTIVLAKPQRAGAE